MTETMEKYPVPGNIPNLVVPKVNPIIWENLTSNARSKDLRLQRIQRPLISGITALLTIQQGPTTPAQEEVLALLAHTNFEINILRRETMKGELNPQCIPLCKPQVPVTTLLFGDGPVARGGFYGSGEPPFSSEPPL